MEIKDLLRGVELFDGLTEGELEKVAVLCKQRQLKDGEVLAKEGEIGRELFIVNDGWVEVSLREGEEHHIVVNLGSGQLIGEMSLIDRGPRSATVKAIHHPTSVQVIQYDDFQNLCQENTNIGYQVMWNLAADLSFKLRHRNLSEN